MKRSLLSILSLLTVALAAVAQPRISSNKETHNFGQIEWKRPVTVEYTITNTGNQPLVLTNVTTSCACAVADWTKEPIAPGGKGVVKASFDAKALGHFEKSIGIYSNASPSLVYLKFTGEVVQEIKDYTKLLPYTIGNIRLDRDEFAFPDVYRGQQPSLTFDIRQSFGSSLRTGIDASASLSENGSGTQSLVERQERNYQTDAGCEPAKDYGLTQTSVYLPVSPVIR